MTSTTECKHSFEYYGPEMELRRCTKCPHKEYEYREWRKLE